MEDINNNAKRQAQSKQVVASEAVVDLVRFHKWLTKHLERLFSYVGLRSYSEKEFRTRTSPKSIPVTVKQLQIEAKEDQKAIINGIEVNLTRQKVTFNGHTQSYEDGMPWRIIARCTVPNNFGTGIVPCSFFGKSTEEINTVVAKMNRIWKDRTGFRILYVKGGNVHLDPSK